MFYYFVYWRNNTGTRDMADEESVWIEDTNYSTTKKSNISYEEMNPFAVKSIREHLHDHGEPQFIDGIRNELKSRCLINEKVLENGIVVTIQDKLRQIFINEKSKAVSEKKDPEIAANDLVTKIDNRII